MLQTSLLPIKSLNKTETPILISSVFFVSKGNLFYVYLALSEDVHVSLFLSDCFSHIFFRFSTKYTFF